MTVRGKEAAAGYLFSLPWFIGFLVFMAAPVAASIYYSFCEFSVLKPPIYVGLDNYRDLFHDEVFWKSLGNTLYYTFLAVPLGTIICIALALLLNTKVRGQAIYRTIFYVPSLVPPVASAMLWLWVLNGDHGILNTLLTAIHLGPLDTPAFTLGPIHMGSIHLPPNWMSTTEWSKPSLILMSLWGGGNAMVIYLASLQDVPTELLESSDLDGAGAWSKFRHITIPMISPVILFNAIMLLIGSLQIFTQPYIMFPQGAPAQSTYMYVMYLFDNAFVYHKFGYACAMGWIMFLIILVFTFVTLKVSEKRVYYQGG